MINYYTQKSLITTKLFKLIYWSSISQINKSKDYYKILGVPKTANQTQIKTSYYKLAKKYHPDTNKGKQQLIKEINQAYEVLSSKELKKQYDESRAQTPKSTYNQTYQTYQNNNRTNQYRKQNPYYKQNPNIYQRKESKFYNADWSNNKFKQQVINQILKAKQRRRMNQTRQTYDYYQDTQNNRKNMNDQYNHEQSNRRYQQYMKKMKQQYQEMKKQQYEAEKKQKQEIDRFIKDTIKQTDRVVKKVAQGVDSAVNYIKNLFKK